MKSTTLLLKQDGSKPDNLRTYNIATPLKHVTFCCLPEICGHDGHDIDSLQRGIVKRDIPNDSGLNNLRTADYLMVGKSHLRR